MPHDVMMYILQHQSKRASAELRIVVSAIESDLMMCSCVQSTMSCCENPLAGMTAGRRR